ncbi:metallophosphoesterase family protein [Chloroflexota bacterium]
MRIGLISDTHIPEARAELPPEVKKAFEGVDLILHAGDIYTLSVLDELEEIAPVLAALGDDDYPGPDDRVKEIHTLKLEGQTLWLVHMRHMLSFPSKIGLSGNPSEQEKDDRPDIVVCGHEHRIVIESKNGILYVCSGSPTLLQYHQGLGTVGILELDSGKATTHIVQLQNSA